MCNNLYLILESVLCRVKQSLVKTLKNKNKLKEVMTLSQLLIAIVITNKF